MSERERDKNKKIMEDFTQKTYTHLSKSRNTRLLSSNLFYIKLILHAYTHTHTHTYGWKEEKRVTKIKLNKQNSCYTKFSFIFDRQLMCSKIFCLCYEKKECHNCVCVTFSRSQYSTYTIRHREIFLAPHRNPRCFWYRTTFFVCLLRKKNEKFPLSRSIIVSVWHFFTRSLRKIIKWYKKIVKFRDSFLGFVETALWHGAVRAKS